MKTILYLSNFWQKAKQAVNEIETELPKVQSENILKPLGNSGKMWVIQFKNLGKTWLPKDLLISQDGKSKNLILLSEKVKKVFEKSPDKVTDFLIGTANKGYFVIKGAFTGCESKKVRLTPNELIRLKLYIKDNI